MPRLPRAVLPGVPHHLTQRGVNRQDVFLSDTNRHVYLKLAAWSFETYAVKPLAYCLMPNHVHWVVVPATIHALSRAFGALHGRYAHYMNAATARTGHFWQNRFFSCALDDTHTWAAMRYVERNPVRAGIVAHAEHWPWSSASARLKAEPSPVPLDLTEWQTRFTPATWQLLLTHDTLAESELTLRSRTYTGRPAGKDNFVQLAELTLDRKLRPSKPGRPKKSAPPPTQAHLFETARA